MLGFKDVIGHEHLIEHLQSAISMGKVSHAYIFDGEKGSGKNFLADIFAKTLQCETKGTEPCEHVLPVSRQKEIIIRTLFVLPMKNQIRSVWTIFASSFAAIL